MARRFLLVAMIQKRQGLKAGIGFSSCTRVFFFLFDFFQFIESIAQIGPQREEDRDDYEHRYGEDQVSRPSHDGALYCSTIPGCCRGWRSESSRCSRRDAEGSGRIGGRDLTVWGQDIAPATITDEKTARFVRILPESNLLRAHVAPSEVTEQPGNAGLLCCVNDVHFDLRYASAVAEALPGIRRQRRTVRLNGGLRKNERRVNATPVSDRVGLTQRRTVSELTSPCRPGDIRTRYPPRANP